MSKNLSDIMRQAQKMQEKLKEVQEGLSTKTVSASSGGGMVTAEVSGALKLMKIKIDPSVLAASDIEMLEDLVVSAVNEAFKRAQDMVSGEMNKVTMGVGIPGLF
ncbi:MAG TPA: YbaB/EbfC family nucleoid-associated protein [Thermodesulfobacteriota bacterium]|nr:YbaB/EbfC family nucleoid-associated protein [Thermodesulfobacteriota bacterium]